MHLDHEAHCAIASWRELHPAASERSGVNSELIKRKGTYVAGSGRESSALNSGSQHHFEVVLWRKKKDFWVVGKGKQGSKAITKVREKVFVGFGWMGDENRN